MANDCTFSTTRSTDHIGSTCHCCRGTIQASWYDLATRRVPEALENTLYGRTTYYHPHCFNRSLQNHVENDTPITHPLYGRMIITTVNGQSVQAYCAEQGIEKVVIAPADPVIEAEPVVQPEDPRLLPLRIAIANRNLGDVKTLLPTSWGHYLFSRKSLDSKSIDELITQAIEVEKMSQDANEKKACEKIVKHLIEYQYGSSPEYSEGFEKWINHAIDSDSYHITHLLLSIEYVEYEDGELFSFSPDLPTLLNKIREAQNLNNKKELLNAIHTARGISDEDFKTLANKVIESGQPEILEFLLNSKVVSPEVLGEFLSTAVDTYLFIDNVDKQAIIRCVTLILNSGDIGENHYNLTVSRMKDAIIERDDNTLLTAFLAVPDVAKQDAMIPQLLAGDNGDLSEENYLKILTAVLREDATGEVFEKLITRRLPALDQRKQCLITLALDPKPNGEKLATLLLGDQGTLDQETISTAMRNALQVHNRAVIATLLEKEGIVAWDAITTYRNNYRHVIERATEAIQHAAMLDVLRKGRFSNEANIIAFAQQNPQEFLELGVAVLNAVMSYKNVDQELQQTAQLIINQIKERKTLEKLIKLRKKFAQEQDVLLQRLKDKLPFSPKNLFV